MRRAADQPRWHSFVRRTGTTALLIVLVVYAVTPYVGFIARSASGPIFIIRPGAIGVGSLTPQAMIQDIPNQAYVGLYFPTVDPLWAPLLKDDQMGVRFYLPFWIPVAGIVWAMAWVAAAGRVRVAGTCPSCGYDLDGCVVNECAHCGIASVICPECGTTTPRASPSPAAALTPSERTPRPPSPARDRSHDPE